jgi:hypothetical protein
MTKIAIHLSHKSLSSVPCSTRSVAALEAIRTKVEINVQSRWLYDEITVDYQTRRDSGKTIVEVSGIGDAWEEEQFRFRVLQYLPGLLDIAMESADLELLQTVGEKIYGDDWEAPLADEFGVDMEAIRSWSSGQRPVPGRVVAELPVLVYSKATEFRERADGLSGLLAQLTGVAQAVVHDC